MHSYDFTGDKGIKIAGFRSEEVVGNLATDNLYPYLLYVSMLGNGDGNRSIGYSGHYPTLQLGQHAPVHSQPVLRLPACLLKQDGEDIVVVVNQLEQGFLV